MPVKVIFRADDVGYTRVHNLGTWRSIEDGVVTACDLILDTPGTEDACQHLRTKPWLSIGWHTHFWGAPVLDAGRVPSMVDESGRFAWRHDKSALEKVDFNEALLECRAELERCRRLLGRVPDVATAGLAGPGADPGPLGEAVRAACKEYGIACDAIGGVGYDHKGRHIFCIVRSIDTLLALAEDAPDIQQVHIANYGHLSAGGAEERVSYTNHLFLNSEEVTKLEELQKAGIPVSIKMTPNSPDEDLFRLLRSKSE